MQEDAVKQALLNVRAVLILIVNIPIVGHVIFYLFYVFLFIHFEHMLSALYSPRIAENLHIKSFIHH